MGKDLQEFDEKEICLKCGSVLILRNKLVSLNTTVTVPLFIEGVLNEIKHGIQTMRKKCGYEVTDHIVICSDATHLLNFDDIRKEVLADAVFSDIHDGCDLVSDICGIKIGIKRLTLKT